MPAQPPKSPSRSTPPRGLSLAVGFVALGAALFVILAIMGGGMDAPTVGLALAGVALVFAVWRLYIMAHALAVPASHDVLSSRTGGVERATLEDRFQRLLRAIKELEFDHEMGKISSADFEELETTYRARAVEVMRELEGTRSLHPALNMLLERRAAEREGAELAAALGDAPTPKETPKAEAALADAPTPKETPKAFASSEAADGEPTATSDVEPEESASRSCAACDGRNDADAKFCKHCGKELVA